MRNKGVIHSFCFSKEYSNEFKREVAVNIANLCQHLMSEQGAAIIKCWRNSVNRHLYWKTLGHGIDARTPHATNPVPHRPHQNSADCAVWYALQPEDVNGNYTGVLDCANECIEALSVKDDFSLAHGQIVKIIEKATNPHR